MIYIAIINKYFPFFFKNYLFIWLCWVLVAAHGIFITSCGILHCGTWKLSSCGMQACCSGACGILVAWPLIKPVSSVLQGKFLTTGPPGKSFSFFLVLRLWYVFYTYSASHFKLATFQGLNKYIQLVATI